MATNNDKHDNDEETALRKVLATMDVQRKAMENEADAIYFELTSPPDEGVEPMGIDTPLVDDDGYPRGDIDVYRARTLRNRFRILQTDHKEMSNKIEALLIQLAALKDPSKRQAEEAERERRMAPKPKPKYDATTGKWVVMNWDGSVAGIEGGEQIKFQDLSRQISEITDPTIASDRSSTRTSTSLQDLAAADPGSPLSRVVEMQLDPFARVNAVAVESPAMEAGLKEEDLIVQFGHLHIDNHDHLQAIATLVPEVAGEGKSIMIQILRRPENNRDRALLASAQQSQDETDMTVAASEQDYKDPARWNRLTLSLQPRPWSGRGLIGCHIVPYHAEKYTHP